MEERKAAEDRSSAAPAAHMPVEKQLFRNFKRAHDCLHVEGFKFFKEYKITIAQFDLMETILLSPARALSIQQLALNTVSRQPNVTRSVGMLEKAGLVQSSKSRDDNRKVMVALTEKGERLIARIQGPLLDLHIAQFRNFNVEELILLNELVKKISCLQETTAN